MNPLDQLNAWLFSRLPSYRWPDDVFDEAIARVTRVLRTTDAAVLVRSRISETVAKLAEYIGGDAPRDPAAALDRLERWLDACRVLMPALSDRSIQKVLGALIRARGPKAAVAAIVEPLRRPPPPEDWSKPQTDGSVVTTWLLALQACAAVNEQVALRELLSRLVRADSVDELTALFLSTPAEARVALIAEISGVEQPSSGFNRVLDAIRRGRLVELEHALDVGDLTEEELRQALHEVAATGDWLMLDMVLESAAAHDVSAAYFGRAARVARDVEAPEAIIERIWSLVRDRPDAFTSPTLGSIANAAGWMKSGHLLADIWRTSAGRVTWDELGWLTWLNAAHGASARALAAEVLDALPPDMRAPALTLPIGRAAIWLGRFELAEQMVREAIAKSDPRSNDPDVRARAATALEHAAILATTAAGEAHHGGLDALAALDGWLELINLNALAHVVNAAARAERLELFRCAWDELSRRGPFKEPKMIGALASVAERLESRQMLETIWSRATEARLNGRALGSLAHAAGLLSSRNVLEGVIERLDAEVQTLDHAAWGTIVGAAQDLDDELLLRRAFDAIQRRRDPIVHRDWGTLHMTLQQAALACSDRAFRSDIFRALRDQVCDVPRCAAALASEPFGAGAAGKFVGACRWFMRHLVGTYWTEGHLGFRARANEVARVIASLPLDRRCEALSLLATRGQEAHAAVLREIQIDELRSRCGLDGTPWARLDETRRDQIIAAIASGRIVESVIAWLLDHDPGYASRLAAEQPPLDERFATLAGLVADNHARHLHGQSSPGESPAFHAAVRAEVTRLVDAGVGQADIVAALEAVIVRLGGTVAERTYDELRGVVHDVGRPAYEEALTAMRATMDSAVRAELAAQFVGLACEIDQLLLFAGRPPGADTTLRIDVHAKRQLVGHLGRRVAVTLDGLDEPLVILTRHGTRVTQLIPLFQAIRSNVEVALSVLVESDAHLRVRVHRNPPEVNLIVENTYRRGAAPRFSTGLGQSLIKRRAVRLGGDAAFEPDAEPWFDVTDGVAAYRTTVTLRLAREE